MPYFTVKTTNLSTQLEQYLCPPIINQIHTILNEPWTVLRMSQNRIPENTSEWAGPLMILLQRSWGVAKFERNPHQEYFWKADCKKLSKSILKELSLHIGFVNSNVSHRSGPSLENSHHHSLEFQCKNSTHVDSDRTGYRAQHTFIFYL